MTYKMYLMSIAGLEEECLWQDAMCLLDSYRKELVHKYKKEKDRMRAIVAGLLLQAGFLELEPDETFGREVQMTGNEMPLLKEALHGQCYMLESRGFIAYLKERAKNESDRLPVEILYRKGEHGKLFWDRDLLEGKLEEHGFPEKILWHFNLSHSGDYVVLVIADVEVGVDIQEPRELKRFPGGYKAASRMEAFVKCTGDGIAKGQAIYKKHQGEVPGYEIQSIHLVDQYALNLCFATEKTLYFSFEK